MPSRILREGILTSEPVNALTERAELFYRRLMSVVDDYGRFYAHPSILRASCYPLRLDRVSEADVKRMLSECVTTGCVKLYNGGKHLFVVKFKQQTRAESKFPEPSENELLIKCEANAKQMCSESESESYAYSESYAGTPASPAPRANRFKVPGLAELDLYAAKIGLPQSEAEKFFNHFESNGWKVGGRSLMRNWQAAMRNWKLNVQTYGNRSTTNIPNPSANPRNRGVIRTGPDYGEAARRKQLRQQDEERQRSVAPQLDHKAAGNGSASPTHLPH